MQTFNCPACGRPISVEVAPNMQVECPLCHQVITVPSIGAAAGIPPTAGSTQLPTFAAIANEPLRKGMATASLVCGILGLFCMPPIGLVGFFLGLIASMNARREPYRYGGGGFAVAGTWTGGASVILGVLAVFVLLPALTTPHSPARRVATMVMLTTLDMGLEAFRNDSGEGSEAYPPSLAHAVANPAGTSPADTFPANQPSQGAELLVWAMAGADSLGTPGFPDNWQVNCHRGSATAPPGLYALDGDGRPVHRRRGPYVDMSKMKMLRRGERLPGGPRGQLAPAACFLDLYDQPILYYRANPQGAAIAAWQTDYFVSACYYMADNARFTGDDRAGIAGTDLGKGSNHPLGQFVDFNAQGFPDLAKPETKGSFGHFIWDQKVTGRPVAQRQDSYLLISAGPDGKYGTADDVTNFQPNR